MLPPVSPVPGWGPSVKHCLVFLPQLLVSVRSSGCYYKCSRQGRYHHNNLKWIKPVTSFVLLCSLLRCLIPAESRHAIMFRFFHNFFLELTSSTSILLIIFQLNCVEKLPVLLIFHISLSVSSTSFTLPNMLLAKVINELWWSNLLCLFIHVRNY